MSGRPIKRTLPEGIPVEEPPAEVEGVVNPERAKWLIAQSMKQPRRLEKSVNPVLALPSSNDPQACMSEMNGLFALDPRVIASLARSYLSSRIM